MATTVRITETYDLKTSVSKLGIIGIHTPGSAQIRKMYPGLVSNHRFIRFLKCDVVGACASVLPADPLQVGVTAGDVAPEDMFNPILYKPVSNESFDSLVSRIYKAGGDIATLGSVSRDETNMTTDTTFDIYYSLLAESKKWKKAMPQNGFSLRGLYPICHTVINTFGNVQTIGKTDVALDADGQPTIDVPDLGTVNVSNAVYTDTDPVGLPITFRGKCVKMPKIPIHTDMTADGTESFNIPKTFVAAFILPPARLHEFYYRMRVSWTIRFEQVCTVGEYGTGAVMKGIGASSYAKDWTYSSAKTEMDNTSASVDTNDVDMNLIMES